MITGYSKNLMNVAFFCLTISRLSLDPEIKSSSLGIFWIHANALSRMRAAESGYLGCFSCNINKPITVSWHELIKLYIQANCKLNRWILCLWRYGWSYHVIGSQWRQVLVSRRRRHPLLVVCCYGSEQQDLVLRRKDHQTWTEVKLLIPSVSQRRHASL